MENHRRQKAKSTGDMFTFPSLSHDFELESELADQLFSNGKFLIHAFPVQSTSVTVSKSMILNRATSFSSQGSLMSSRSNSTNSHSSSNSNSNSSSTNSHNSSNNNNINSKRTNGRNNNSNSNSSVSSARTNTNSNSSRRKLSTINHARSGKEWQSRNYCNEYGHSQRWQFISPVPVLSNRRCMNKRKGGNGKREAGGRKGVCRRFFGWLVSTCQECHAIEPSKRLKVSM